MFYNNVMKKIFTETFIEVPFYDLDSMDVVWHGNYIKYLEVARCDLLSKIGYTYNDMRADGVAYPVATMDLKFIKPAVFSQKVFDQALLHTLFYRCIDGAFQITAVVLGCCFDIVQQLAVAQKRRTSLQDFAICIIIQINELDNQFE